jgi:1,4-alpha-glucan branching enzyme
MGGELAQWREWHHDGSLDWNLLAFPLHAGVQRWVADLNRLYVGEPAMHECDCEGAGFEWIDCHDADNSTLSFLRTGKSTNDMIVAVCNFTPVPRYGYHVGVPNAGFWKELLNSDARDYGGSGLGNQGGIESNPIARHGRPHSVEITLPPLAVVYFVNRAADAV